MTTAPKLLLLGKDGQVGRELQRSLASARLVAIDRPELDFERLDELRALVRREAPDVIVNAAAYTAVDRAESEPELCRRINAEAVAAVAEEARSLAALFVHYSTDYVFDGTKTGVFDGTKTGVFDGTKEGWYEETDEPKPLGVYGLTKLEGEQAAATAGRYLVFRTSWVYAAHGHNFIRTMLRLAQERESLDVIDDQWGAPTGAALLADTTALAIDRCLRPETAIPSGLYHLVARGETTWCRFARFVLAEARRRGLAVKAGPEAVRAIPTSAYPTAAKRPANSRLSTAKLRAALGIELPPWEEGVAAVVAALV